MTSTAETTKLKKSCSESGISKKKNVWFDYVEIIEFPMELGDNPAVNEGAPLTIGWRYQKKKSYEIDYYEVYRDDRRGRKELALSTEQRTGILLKQGYTLSQIQTCVQECNRVKQEREQSCKNMKWEKVNMAIESTGKTLKRIMIGSKISPVHHRRKLVRARSA